MNNDEVVRVLTGVVVSTKMTKSVVVRIDRVLPHPLYGKYIKRSTKVMADDLSGECAVGDVVEIKSCKPISKRKVWTLSRIVERASVR